MSWQNCPAAKTQNPAVDEAPVETVIIPRSRDLGGFEVRRALPARERQMVGPFIFFDQIGPSHFEPGKGLDVRPHPHIGLATLTYLFEGEILHRDSLGTVQTIRPGAVNLMTAGRGIAHSERTPDTLRPGGPSLFGIQAWIALPKAAEEAAPGFSHHTADSLPVIKEKGIKARLVAGTAYGAASSVPTYSDTLYVDAMLDAGAQMPIDTDHEERALFIVTGAIEISGHRHGLGEMLILRPGDALSVKALEDSRILLIGGEPMDGPRHIWWNFVSSSKERIEQAKKDWRGGRFDAVTGDDEFIPLPDMPGP